MALPGRAGRAPRNNCHVQRPRAADSSGCVDDTGAMSRASDRFAEGDWAETYRVLAARSVELDVDELARFAVAAYLTGREEESFALWERGHHRCSQAGDVVRAARFGVCLAPSIAEFARYGPPSGTQLRKRR